METTEEKVVKIGVFKSKEKFIEFIGGKGNINFISTEAIIDGKYLSDTVSGIKFKLSIRDNNTLDFDEIDSELTTKDERVRLLDIINDKSVSPFRKNFVISELPFKSIVGDINLYLSVDYVKPYDKLSALFDEEDVITQISHEQSSKLDDLLDLFGVTEDEMEEVKVVPIIKEEEVVKSNHLEESFKKMNEEKIEEIKKRIEHNKKEVGRISQEVKQSEKKLTEAKKDLTILESRLESLTPKEDPNGYVFNISEVIGKESDFDEVTSKKILDKVTKVGLNPKAFADLLSTGTHKISLSVDKLSNVDLTLLPTEITDKLNTIGVIITDGELSYRGDLGWGELTNKMIRLGFEQDQNFDKICHDLVNTEPHE